MKIAIMGTGGVGGYFGGLLARSGMPVTFIARGAHLAAMREKGLRVRSVAAGDFTLAPVQATDRPADIGPVDLVLFCVKTYHTAEAARALLPLIQEHTTVLTLQNGVDNAERLGAILGEEHVLAGPVYIASAIEAPGIIHQSGGPCKIILGERDGRITERVERIYTTFQQAHISCELTSNVRKALWEKFVFICGFSGMTALLRAPGGLILDCPETTALYREAMQEIVTLGRSLGVDLEEELVERYMQLTETFRSLKSSLLVDLEQGRRLEIDALQGTVVRLGREKGIPTPVNRFIYACLKAHDPA